ncbi:hypothetical protein FRB99_006445 [Tulasnella sp. 403]|nr:hypothetical protein FRB99_006445 [Tulasnella sp. 403]
MRTSTAILFLVASFASQTLATPLPPHVAHEEVSGIAAVTSDVPEDLVKRSPSPMMNFFRGKKGKQGNSESQPQNPPPPEAQAPPGWVAAHPTEVPPNKDIMTLFRLNQHSQLQYSPELKKGLEQIAQNGYRGDQASLALRDASDQTQAWDVIANSKFYKASGDDVIKRLSAAVDGGFKPTQQLVDALKKKFNFELPEELVAKLTKDETAVGHSSTVKRSLDIIDRIKSFIAKYLPGSKPPVSAPKTRSSEPVLTAWRLNHDSMYDATMRDDLTRIAQYGYIGDIADTTKAVAADQTEAWDILSNSYWFRFRPTVVQNTLEKAIKSGFEPSEGLLQSLKEAGVDVAKFAAKAVR